MRAHLYRLLTCVCVCYCVDMTVQDLAVSNTSIINTPPPDFHRNLVALQGVAQQVITFAGDGDNSQDGIGTNAEIHRPGGISISSDGSFAVIAAAYGNKIRKLVISTSEVTTISDSTAFDEPYGIALSADNSFALVAGNNDHRIRKVIISTGEVSTFVGTHAGNSDGVGTDARLTFPRGVAISGDGVLAVIVDCSNDRIRKVIISTQVVSLIAGSSPGSSDGTGTSARFNGPRGVTVSSDGSFAVVADRDNHRLRKLVLSTRVVTTIAGSVTGYLDGTGTNARFDKPYNIDISSDDTYVVVADFNSHRIRKCILSTGVVTTIAGGSSSGSSDGIGTNARFWSPIDAALSPSDTYVLVADYRNSRVRLVFMTDLDSPSPTSQPTGQPSGYPTCHPTGQPTGHPSGEPTGKPSTLPSGQPTGQPTGEPTGHPSGLPSGQPSSGPTGQPSGQPTSLPTAAPSGQPTGQPTSQPTSAPSGQPSGQPTCEPTGQPTGQPTGEPTGHPSGLPSGQPSSGPTGQPSGQPTSLPTAAPSGQPTGQPTSQPTSAPSGQPSGQPTCEPTGQPTGQPTGEPTGHPSGLPSGQPSSGPTGQPSGQPTSLPTAAPSGQPTGQPTSQPTSAPSGQPSGQPTCEPTGQPTGQPTGEPTGHPSGLPSGQPSSGPTGQPSGQPTSLPTAAPSGQPTGQPTSQPTSAPSGQPSGQPTCEPTGQPTGQPTGEPTGHPSGLPSGQPSGQPTSLPTAAPSGQPTGQPTSQPTSAPSGQPSGQPTCEPTGQPTGQPTGEPTGHPSGLPSGQPSGQPTSLPTAAPSGQPTGQPTSQPTSAPSGQPSGQPTCEPTGQPTGQPTGEPTGQPSAEPTGEPSALPTGQPSSCPTGQPTGQPSSHPSTQPTGQPTSAPTGKPSEVPTGQPTSEPTGEPTGKPTWEPSGQPTSLPTGGPSMDPTGQPTCKPTSEPSSQPSGWPSCRPSGKPTGVPSGEPSSQPSGQPTGAPTCIPSGQPTGLPSGLPSGSPTVMPSSFPSGQPSFCPTGLPSSVPTELLSVFTSTTESSIDVYVRFSQEGIVFCASFFSGVIPESFGRIVAQNKFALVDSTTAPQVITLNGLQSGTLYDVYCLAKSVDIVSDAIVTVMESRHDIKTQCCKRVIVTLTGTSFVSGNVVTNFISIHATGTPSNDLVVSLSIGNSSGLLSNMLFPSSVTLNGKNWDDIHKVSLTSSSSPGSYYTSVSLGGPSAQEFEVVFGNNGVQSFILESPNVEPTTPRLSSAAFSSDGMYIIVVFDSPTDQARKLSSFSCEDVLILTGASESSCLWSTSSTLTITLKGINRPVVGDYVSVRTNSVRAPCRSDLSVCDQWTSVPSISIPIVAPLVPMIPVVAISAPSTVGRCDEVLIDLTSSWPSGGRRWSSIAVNVTSSSVESAVAVEQFFATQYTISPPTSLPRGVLVAGYVYTFEIKLCNFLGACGIGFHQISAVDSALPVVSIAGQQSRTVSMASPLLLQAQGYTSFCDGTRSFANLIYTWTASRDGIIDHTLTSISSDKTKFKLPAFALRPNSVYDVVVTVVSPLSGLSSSAAVQLSVPSSKIVAAISGATERTIRQGDILIVDAAGSYDEESRTSAGLSFSWSCYQQEPTLSSTCDLQLQPALSHVMITSPYSTPTGNVYAITVTVHDSTRQSHETVMITVTERSAPQLSITSRNGAIKINPSDDLILYGSVLLQDMATVTWAVDDPLLDLKSVSRTAVTAPLRHGSHQFNLVIPALVLSPKSTPYVFSLMSSGARSSLAIAINVPPSPGVFEVVPSNGTAMITKFKFAASEWSDDDIPLSYEFAYIETQTSKVVHGRSEYSFATSLLPPGKSNDDLLLCQVRVFDVLNAYSSESVSLIVNDPQMTSSTLLRTMGHLISSSDGNIDAQKETLSVVSSVLNGVDCMILMGCSAFNRSTCTSTRNICGDCIAGYYWVVNEYNSMCYDMSQLEIALSKWTLRNCSTNTDCDMWESCEESTEYGFSVCERMSKSCVNNCSSNGRCLFVDANVGTLVDRCDVGDHSCDVVCQCNDGYYGSACDILEESFMTTESIRSQLAVLLLSVSKVDDPTIDSIAHLASFLSSITQSMDTISENVSSAVLTIASSILDASTSTLVPSEAYSEVFMSLDSISQATIATFLPGEQKRENILQEVVNGLDSFADTVLNEMTVGLSPKYVSTELFRLAFACFGGSNNLSLALPQSDIESHLDIATSQLILSGLALDSQRVAVMSVKPKVYKNASMFTSNVVRIRLNAVQWTTNQPNITVVIRNSKEERLMLNTGQVVNTTCMDGDWSVHELTCSGLKGDITVTHMCNGTYAIMETLCPDINVKRSCDIIAGKSLYTCELQHFTESDTTCFCTLAISNTTATSRRLNSAVKQSKVLEVVAISTLVVNDFSTTVTTADDLNSVSDLEDTIVNFRWSGGLSGILLCSLRQYYDSDRVVGKESGKKKEIARSTMDKSDVKAYLTSYVNEVFPSVYRTKPALLRLWDEICKHHRYLVLFTANGSNGDSVRMLTGVHLLTVQSMLMFILAVCYDLQYPNDEGECSGYTTERECVRRKSPFDVDTSVCRWVEDADADDSYLCESSPIAMSVKIFIIISIVVAIFTAPINLLVDFLFIEILSAPTADKIKEENNTVYQKAARIGRRVSAATVDTVKAFQGRINSLRRRSSAFDKLTVQTTRVVPEAAIDAQELAAISIGNVLQDVQEHVARVTKNQELIRKESQVFQQRYKLEKYRKSLHDRRDVDTKLNQLYNGGGQDVGKSSLEELFLELTVDITEQRRVLKRIQQEGFDAMWGVDPTGEFSRQRELTFLCIPRTCSVERAIKSELKYVRDETQAKFEKLRFASDVQIGIEILHQFLMDILGRDTPVAKIFLTKSEEDFRHSYVVTKFVKAIAWSCVVVLNLFFVWFSMLRGLQRGYHWQKLYMIACVMQFVIEILFYETSECAIIHFFIPDLARNEVHTASFALHQAVNKICSSSLDAAANVILDAPRYLFVSTNLAKRFPNLLESAIVMSYHTYSPGEFSKKWRVSHSTTIGANVSPWSRSNRRVSRFAVSTALIRLMQHMGAMSPTVQRVTIHSLQPLVIGGLFVLWVFLWTYPLSFVFVGFFVMYVVYTYLRDFQSSRDECNGNIHPSVKTACDKSKRPLSRQGPIAVMPSGEDVQSHVLDRPQPIVNEESKFDDSPDPVQGDALRIEPIVEEALDSCTWKPLCDEASLFSGTCIQQTETDPSDIGENDVLGGVDMFHCDYNSESSSIRYELNEEYVNYSSDGSDSSREDELYPYSESSSTTS